MLSFTQPLKGMAELEEIEKSLEKNQGIAADAVEKIITDGPEIITDGPEKNQGIVRIPEGTSDP